MIYYNLFESYTNDDYKYYQVLPYDLFNTIRLLKRPKLILDFLKNGSFNKEKLKKIAFKKNLVEFDKRRKYNGKE
jgi:hypothetical protein